MKLVTSLFAAFALAFSGPAAVPLAALALVPAAVVALAPAPAEAGSYAIGAATPVYANANAASESCDAATDGGGTLVAAHASTNTIGTAVDLCATASAWSALDAYFTQSSTAGARFLVSITLDGTNYLPPIYVQSSTAPQGPVRYRIPMQVASSAAIKVKLQSSTGGASLKVHIQGIVASATSPPGYTVATEVATTGGDLANTRPSTTDIATTSDGSTWTQIRASTAATYGAFLFICGDNGTGNTAQTVSLSLGTGTATEIYRFLAGTNTSVPIMPRAAAQLIEQTVASGTPIVARAWAATTTDSYRCQLIGFR